MPNRTVEIRALTPLLFRDGKPFNQAANTETSAKSLTMPLPSTIAGFVRTQIGTTNGSNWSNHEFLKDLHAKPVHAPLLLRNNQFVLPAPRDAVVYENEDGKLEIMRLKPRILKEGEGCDLPDDLRPLEITQDVKPQPGYNFWSQDALEQWLINETPKDLEKITGLPTELRTHVSVNPETLTTNDGQLFGVTYSSFESRVEEKFYEWSLRARVNIPDANMPSSLGHLGGERRPAVLTVLDDSKTEKNWFTCPTTLREKFANQKCIRMILMTPAIFKHGWKPAWLDSNSSNPPQALGKVKLKLISAAVGRREPVSGWNLRSDTPRAVRWMVPAGSVYFFEVLDGNLNDLLEAWLKPVSDNEQDRKDGYGLAIWACGSET